jgi:signal transduction histidine kinase
LVASDITQRKLLEAQFLRAQRLESVGRLAGGIAHDLNNILTPLLMSVPMLRHCLHDAEGDSILDTLETSARRGADIVKQVLTFARGVETRGSQLQPKIVIKEVLKLIQETFPKNLEIRESVVPDLNPVRCDATHLHQVLMNLCINARDAMPGGGILELSAGNEILDEALTRQAPGAKPGPYLAIEIADTGTGIPEENFEKIFEPFFTTKGPDHGTGLGLSTVIGIVKSYGGFVQVFSKMG